MMHAARGVSPAMADGLPVWEGGRGLAASSAGLAGEEGL